MLSCLGLMVMGWSDGVRESHRHIIVLVRRVGGRSGVGRVECLLRLEGIEGGEDGVGEHVGIFFTAWGKYYSGKVLLWEVTGEGDLRWFAMLSYALDWNEMVLHMNRRWVVSFFYVSSLCPLVASIPAGSGRLRARRKIRH